MESGVINVPLKEGVAAMRVALFHEHQGGYVEAVGPAGGKNVDRGDTSGGRLSLLIEPTSKLHVRLTALEQAISQRGSSVVDYELATGRPTEGDLKRQLDVREPYLVNVGLVSADIEYDLGWARINSVTSAQQEKSRNRLDASFYDPVLSTPDAPITDTGLDSEPGMRKHKQEFRLTSASGTLEWLGGLYFDSEVGRNSQLLAGTLETDNSEVDAVALAQPSTYKELAAYADLTWNLAKDWSLTGGARVARNRQVYATIVTGAAPVGGNPAESSKTYLATLRYAFTPTSNVHLRAASGYRPGGPNPPALDGEGNVDPTAPKSFKSDSLRSYEAGYKADLLDKRLSVEAAICAIELPSDTLVDLQSGVTPGHIGVGLYVRNLFDKRAILGADAALVAFGSPLHATVAQPRTIGATVSASF